MYCGVDTSANALDSLLLRITHALVNELQIVTYGRFPVRPKAFVREIAAAAMYVLSGRFAIELYAGMEYRGIPVGTYR